MPQSPAKRPKTSSGGWAAWWRIAILPAAGSAAYFSSFAGAFVFDDQQHIVDNPAIRALWPPWECMRNSSRPLVNLTLAVNYALGGTRPWGYHLFNLLVHLAAGVTLFALVRRVLMRLPQDPSLHAGANTVAFFSALLWLVHPLTTQAVTYVIQRAESMMALFYLLTLYCILRSRESTRPALWSVSAVAACALGMGSKAVMVTAPVGALLFDRVILGSSWKEIGRRGGLYAGLASTWAILAAGGVVQGLIETAPEARSRVGFGLRDFSAAEYLISQPQVILHYLRLCVSPYPLCFDYGWPVAKGMAQILIPSFALVAAIGASVWGLVCGSRLAFLGAAFFLILAPTSSFIPIRDLCVEHRMYLPLAAVVIVGVLAIWRITRAANWAVRNVLFFSLAAVLGLVTFERNRIYHDPESLWRDVVDCRPDNPRGRNNLGAELARRGRLQASEQQLRQAINLAPKYAEAHYNLGLTLARSDRPEDAVDEYRRALELIPDYGEAHNNLGVVLARRGDMKTAAHHFSEAARLLPERADARANLENALQHGGAPR